MNFKGAMFGIAVMTSTAGTEDKMDRVAVIISKTKLDDTNSIFLRSTANRTRFHGSTCVKHTSARCERSKIGCGLLPYT
jgi:2-phospho-L-lactate guanylyltransferase (CobY/MobA/RfbA family)